MRFGGRRVSGLVTVQSLWRAPSAHREASFRTVKQEGQALVSGTQRCTTCFVAVQGGLPVRAQRMAKFCEAAVLTIYYGFSGAIAAHMYHPSCRRDVERGPEEDEVLSVVPERRVWYKGRLCKTESAEAHY